MEGTSTVGKAHACPVWHLLVRTGSTVFRQDLPQRWWAGFSPYCFLSNPITWGTAELKDFQPSLRYYRWQ